MQGLVRALVAVVLLGSAAISQHAVDSRPAHSADRPLALGTAGVAMQATAGTSGWLTVTAEGLPLPADQYCVYLQMAQGGAPRGIFPLAHFIPPGYGEQMSPLIPTGPGAGIGAYQPGYGMRGAATISLASCTSGQQPKSLFPVASTPVTVSFPTALSFGMREIGTTPLGSPFTVTLAAHSTPTCLFIAPEAVLPSVSIHPGVPVPANAGSASLTVPASLPWGVYQIFWTKSAANASCSESQLRAGAILDATGWAPGRWVLRLESEGSPSAGSGLAVHASRAYDPDRRPADLCLALWSDGRYVGVEHTFPAAQAGLDATLKLPAPPSLVGGVAITGTKGACQSGRPPSRFDAYTVAAIGARTRPPTPVSLPGPDTRARPQTLPHCPALPVQSPKPSVGSHVPGIAYSTYLGAGTTSGMGVATAPNGTTYVTLALSQPVGPPRSGSAGCLVVLAPGGDRILRSEVLSFTPRSVALDHAENVWITGDGLEVVKLNRAGKLLFSLLVHGRDGGTGTAIALDPAGDAFIAGSTSSPDFPTSRGSLEPTYPSTVPGCPPACTFLSDTAVVLRLSPTGHITYSTYLGSAGTGASGITVDPSGDVFVSGPADRSFSVVSPLPGTACTDFSTYLAELNPAGNRVLRSTCLLPPARGSGLGMGGPDALGKGRVMVGGDGLAVAVDLSAHKIVWTVPVAGHINGIALDGAGNTWLGGVTDAPSFLTAHPIEQRPHKETCGVEDATHSCTDGFVMEVSSRGKILLSTLLGGTRDDAVQGVAPFGVGSAVATGFTASADFPVSRALQSTNRGTPDTNGYHGGPVNALITRLAVGTR